MAQPSEPPSESVSFEPQPEAANWIIAQIAPAENDAGPVGQFVRRLVPETGARLIDWLDEVGLSSGQAVRDELRARGFAPIGRSGVSEIWQHRGALLPFVRLTPEPGVRLVLRVDSVDFFVTAQGQREAATDGLAGSVIRRALGYESEGLQLWVQERHGSPLEDGNRVELGFIQKHLQAFQERPRDLEADAGYAESIRRIEVAVHELGTSYACDLFFEAERDYWYGKNRAARVQKARQDALGLGWGNHDQHTYRSSRQHYRELIRALERLGFRCRERFHAGGEAGWGAQVLEQEQTGIVIVAAVDLAAEEVVLDFPHGGLEPRDELGTIGLWCLLHGEAFLSAGMHSLECQFDFAAVTEQLAAQGVKAVEPLTDLPHFKQAFTVGEMWPVPEERLAQALAAGHISAEQADSVRQHGALGSHLELLERNDGYKGFNQTKVGDVILKTDSRGV